MDHEYQISSKSSISVGDETSSCTHGHAQNFHCALNLCTLQEYRLRTNWAFLLGDWCYRYVNAACIWDALFRTQWESTQATVVKRPFPTTVCISRLFVVQGDSRQACSEREYRATVFISFRSICRVYFFWIYSTQAESHRNVACCVACH